MSRRVRRSLLSMLAALAVMVGAAAIAWACTPQAVIYLDPSSTGQAGSTITVTGEGFIPGPVEVRMDSGRALATTTGPEFSISVQIPAAKPGIYYINAIAYKPDGTVAGQASRALRVRAPAAEREQPAPTQRPAPRRERTQGTPERPAVGDRPPAPVKAPATAPADPVIEPAPVAETAQRPQAATPPVAERALPKPQPRSPSVPPLSELWSAPAPAGPSLVGAPTNADASAMLLVGIILVALGLTGLGGAGYALMRIRSRPPARDASGQDALPIPEAETRVVSIEDELQALIAASSARAQPGTSSSEQASPRETADSPN